MKARKPLTFLADQPCSARDQPPDTPSLAPQGTSAGEVLPAPPPPPENLAAKVRTNIEIEEAALGNFYREMDLAARNTTIETH